MNTKCLTERKPGQCPPTEQSQTASITKSQSVCFAPIAGCLIKCEEQLGSDGDWRTKNPAQKRFLAEYYNQARSQVRDLPELESIASIDVAVINKFLRDRGFTIQLQDLGLNDDAPRYNFASVFDLKLEWKEPGRVTDIRHGAFPAVSMKDHICFAGSPSVPNPILSVLAKNGDTVRMSVLDEQPTEFDLADLAWKAEASLKASCDFEGAVFPMIDYKDEIDIMWLKEMNTKDSANMPWYVEQALQQTKFRMNEIGARAQSAVAMGMKFGFCAPLDPKPPLIIDKPFMLWVVRPGMARPLFVAHFTEDSWKKPDSLS